MHTADLRATQRQDAPRAPQALLYRFHVSMSWKTTTGMLASAGIVKVAANAEQATRFAVSEVKRDRRRRYYGGMQASAMMLTEAGQ